MFSDQIGLTPEEVISKIMENPDVAMAFQNPRVQAALMEVRFLSSLNIYFDMISNSIRLLLLLQCSENPMNIMKYQNDKEVKHSIVFKLCIENISRQ